MNPSSGLSYLKACENSIEGPTEAFTASGHGSGLALFMDADPQQVMDSRHHSGSRVFWILLPDFLYLMVGLHRRVPVCGSGHLG